MPQSKPTEAERSKYEIGKCGACGEDKEKFKDDYQCLDCRELDSPLLNRLEAAEEVCWTLLMMMALGGLELPQEWRDYFSPAYDKWVNLAVDTGIMESVEEAETTKGS